MNSGHVVCSAATRLAAVTVRPRLRLGGVGNRLPAKNPDGAGDFKQGKGIGDWSRGRGLGKVGKPHVSASVLLL